MEQTTFPATLSFWEIRQYLQDVDLLVVGSGIVGLTSAIFYRRQHPNAKVVVVERGILPFGASTKNAGFACFGSLSEILADLKSTPEKEVFETVRKRVDGLQELRKLLGDAPIGYEPCGGYEIFGNADEEVFFNCLDQLEEMNVRVAEVTGLSNTYAVKDSALSKFSFKNVNHLVLNQHEGAIDTGKMMSSLLKLAQQLDISVLNGLAVEQFDDVGSAVSVAFRSGWNLKCRHLHIATNGFAKELLPDLDVNPARAQVLVTKPIANLKVKGTFHMHEGFYYFRNIGDRILLGGGRHLNFEQETTSDLITTELIQHDLEAKLRDIILSEHEFEIEHRWAGIMGVGANKTALVKRLSPNVTCAVRMGGMGVAIGTSIGKESAEMIG